MNHDPPDILTDTIHLLTSARIPTRYGEFQLALYENSLDEKDHLALVHGNIDAVQDVLVRIHSECFTGDVIGSLRCDCGEQLNTSIRMIAEEGAGIILYLRQEGRGIGLHDKLRAYNLQDEGYDTVDANLALGHGADERDYTIGALMLNDLEINSVRLLTNNPEKIESLETHGIDVVERVPLQPELNKHNTDYLRTKVERMQHMLELQGPHAGSDASRGTLRLNVLRRHMEQPRAPGDLPFTTLLLRQGLDGSVIPIEGRRVASLTAPLRSCHDAVVTSPTQFAELAETLGSSASMASPVRLIVVDPGLEGSVEAYQRAAAQSPLTIVTTSASTSSPHSALRDLDLALIHAEANDEQQSFLQSMRNWLSDQKLNSVFVYGLPELERLLLAHQDIHHMFLQIDTKYCQPESSIMSLDIPFAISKPIQYSVDDQVIISGKIDY